MDVQGVYLLIVLLSPGVYGEENVAEVLGLSDIGEHAWYGEIAIAVECPPGFSVKHNQSCECDTFGNNMLCSPNAKQAFLAPNFWIGFINGSYYITQCPSNYCTETKKRGILLPTSSAELDSTLCAPNRTGTEPLW